MIITLLIILLALLAGTFFRTAEAAIFTLSDSRIRTLVEERLRFSSELSALRARPERLLLFLRIGAALADVAIAVTSAQLGYTLGGIAGLVAGIAVAVILLLVGGTLLPTHWAARQAVRFSLYLAPLLLFGMRIFSPLLYVLELVSRTTPRTGFQAESITELHIRQITALVHDAGEIEEHERQIIERAFRLDETKAWDVMTPRVDIFAWRDDLTLGDIAPELDRVPYSRVPIYGESVDDVTGVLHIREVYHALLSGRADVALRTLARQPLIVPGSVSLTTLLRDFQTRRIHMAIVVDEYGGTDGLVTLEDVIEELVGDIVDEMDIEEEQIVRVSRDEILATGDADLREVNEHLTATLPMLEHRSLNGYLLEELGGVPEAGDRLEREEIEIEILESSDTQVLRARLTRIPPHEAGSGVEENEVERDAEAEAESRTGA